MASSSLPDFLIIGAQKAGTTALKDSLAMHLAVYMAKGSIGLGDEIHFFSNQWTRGVDWYRQHFMHPEKLQGEKSPSYLRRVICHRRMHEIVPRAKLLVLLRNPVSRAYSQWNHFNKLHRQGEGFQSWRELP